MIALYFEDIINVGPDGQTQEGIVAYFTDFALAHKVCEECKEKYKTLEFRLIQNAEAPIINPQSIQERML